MTQRTLDQIRDSLKDYATAQLGLVDSVVAEWKILQEIFVYAIWIFEGIMVSFQTTINTTIQAKQPPTLAWWYDTVKNFQKGYELQVNSDGILAYPEEDEDAKIIAQALIDEYPGTTIPLRIKVAKDDGGLTKLEELGELQQFVDYIKAKHPPGINYSIASTDPDQIKYDIVVEYDPKYTNIGEVVAGSDGQGGQLGKYRDEINFNRSVYVQAMLAKVIEHPAIKNAYFTMIQGKEHDGGYSAIDASIDYNYELIAGYFIYDTDNSTIKDTEGNIL